MSIALKKVSITVDSIKEIEHDWECAIGDDESISPDKYMAVLSYFHEILSNEERINDENENLLFALSDQDGYTQGVFHVIHARKKSVENGWLKVQSSRLSPVLDLYSSSYDELEYHSLASKIYATIVTSVISLARELNVSLVKYYSGGKDKDLIFAIAKSVNKKEFNETLGVSSEAKGAWVHIKLD